LNLVDPEGSTALVIAIVNGHYDVAARLAERGANPNIGDAAGMTALYAAVDMEHPASLTNRPTTRPSGRLTAADCVDVLLKHGADPNIPLKATLLMKQHNGGDAALSAGATPLMRAAKANDLRLIKALAENGADPMRKLANGTTALSMVLAVRAPRVLTPDQPMFQTLQIMLEKGLDANTAADGGPMLHQSLDRGVEFVRMLVAHGAKLDLKDATGRTPLDIAMGVAPTVPSSPAAAAGRGVRGAPAARGGGLGGGRGAAPGRGFPAAVPPAAGGPPDAATIAFLREASSRVN
jgi:ankyrin repeat protein